jgi:hypothetical protein
MLRLFWLLLRLPILYRVHVTVFCALSSCFCYMWVFYKFSSTVFISFSWQMAQSRGSVFVQALTCIVLPSNNVGSRIPVPSAPMLSCVFSLIICHLLPLYFRVNLSDIHSSTLILISCHLKIHQYFCRRYFLLNPPSIDLRALTFLLSFNSSLSLKFYL